MNEETIVQTIFLDLQYNMMGESSELFVNCLEAMVETCLPMEEPSVAVPPSPRPYHLSSSLSSLTIGSPTDKGESYQNSYMFKETPNHSIAAFSLKAFSTESLDNDGVGSINSLRRPSCTKARAHSMLTSTPMTTTTTMPSSVMVSASALKRSPAPDSPKKSTNHN